ncbi:KEOPS complex subunit Cgi121 [Salarchaeum sp. JOR-1]|uniref:KEOPS complex subunit Cgi121 n=1 Tax=Salarchaeum sp. JOR-1 TaxID=2599399 RepID=UPI001198BC20|nr:KEOPS complex subunit Cgi121 [Salarchaeum sp. JOR-1]QDX40198.1 KEOPS complex component [Salarchaeum sp. JOR-1]
MRTLEGRVTVEDVDAFVETLSEVGEEHGSAVQAFDAAYVAGRVHLETAVRHANRAFDRGENVARDRAVEILLYAAGRRQIRRALEMGVSSGETDAVIVVDGGDEPAAIDELRALVDERETLAALDERVLTEFFEISDAERAATDATLTDLVRERVALLDVDK